MSIAESDLRRRDGKLIENWYVACLSRELKPGQMLRRIVYDEAFVVYRDESGRPACLPDRCLHRHAKLSEGVLLPGSRIGCPYHGWVYGSDGTVVEVPSEGQRKPCVEAKLKARACVEQDGMIWIWMGEGAPRTPTPPFRLPHQEKTDWVSYFMITDFDNEVTHLAENFMDVPHTVFVHKAWFRNQAIKEVPISCETKDGSVLITYKREDDEIGFTGWILNPKREPMTHTDHFFLPNVTRVDYNFGSRNAFIIISQITPVSRLKSRVYTAIIYRLGWLTFPLKPFFQFYTRQVIEQDVDIMRNQSENFKVDMTCKFNETDADVVHKSIEKLREMARDGDATAFSRSEKVEKTIWI